MKVTSMANLVTLFNHDKVYMITGARQNDPDARTYLHGIGRTPLSVTGNPDDFLTKMPNKTSFAQLHFAANGKVFWVNIANVKALRQPTAEDLVHFPNAQAVLLIGPAERFVTETVIATQAAINAAGGNL